MKLLKIILIVIGILVVLRFLAPTTLPKIFTYAFSSGLSVSRSQFELILIGVVVIILLLVFRVFRMKK